MFSIIDTLTHTYNLILLPENIGLINSVLLITFFISFLVQMVYYLWIFSKAGKKSPKQETTMNDFIPVSVVICARDEAENLEKNLPLFLGQNYPEYEVIVVNDCSEDNSEEILQRLSEKYPNLRVRNIIKDPKFSHGKKLALTIGIKATKYDTLLLSDADCYPASKNWIRLMIRNFSNDKEVVLGIGLYEKRKGLLNILIRYEAAFIAMQYTAMARAGKPYMGVGRNLSYKKEVFFRNRGFASHLRLESGDDDLFINEVSNAQNTAVENLPDSYTFSAPETSFSSWVHQKKRHLKTGKFYQQSVKTILGGEYLSRILLIISFIVLLLKPEFFLLVLIVYILNLIVKGIIYTIVFSHYHEKYLFLPATILEGLIPFIYSFLHIFNYLERKRSRWQ